MVNNKRKPTLPLEKIEIKLPIQHLLKQNVTFYVAAAPAACGIPLLFII